MLFRINDIIGVAENAYYLIYTFSSTDINPNDQVSRLLVCKSIRLMTHS